ncbi:MAG: GntR family transcriptional regulator [Rhodobacteraceae bacterium]|nr:GntR family transcriptional regulator [Paracoccaceae bacterium]
MLIRNALAEEIRQGELRSHDRLPSERVLSERFGVSRATARQTLIQLEKEGLAYTKDRSNRFVAEPSINYDLSTTVSFFATGVDRKSEVQIEVRKFETVTADIEETTALMVPAGARIHKYARICRLGSKLAFVEEEYVSADRFPNLEAINLEQPLVPFFEDVYGVKASHDRIAITMIGFPDHIAKALELPPPCAGLLLEQTILDAQNKPISVGRQYWRGDVAHFSGTIMR